MSGIAAWGTVYCVFKLILYQENQGAVSRQPFCECLTTWDQKNFEVYILICCDVNQRVRESLLKLSSQLCTNLNAVCLSFFVYSVFMLDFVFFTVSQGLVSH